MAVAAAMAMMALANWTNAVETLVAKWHAWTPAVLGVLRLIAPWLLPLLVLYGATALLMTAYREWRNGQRAQRQRRRSEIEHLQRFVRSLLWEIESSFKKTSGDVAAYDDFEYALQQVKDALVQSVEFERRSTLFTVVSNLEKRCVRNLPTVTRTDLQPFLTMFHEWATWAEWEVNPKTVGRPLDPLAPQR